MGNAISSAITHAWVASNTRRVNRWLENATEELVLNALTDSFFPAGKEYANLPAAPDARFHIKEIFGAYGSIGGTDKQRYWHEKDLELFLSSRFPGSEVSASIPILWRCFQYHAWFPFPPKPQPLDYGAFQRAIGFLAAEGTLRLGEDADGITMDADRYPDHSARASKHLWILFRSFSSPSSCFSGRKSIESAVADPIDTQKDLMEVLALTQPVNHCIMPAPIEELRPHARRILSSSTLYTYSSIPRGDFLSLLKLILSVQLDKPEWEFHEPYFYTGRIQVPPNLDILQGSADAILRGLTSSEKNGVDWQSFQTIMNVYLPDFPSQFRLIFTSFLSPLAATDRVLNISAPEPTIPIPYAQYLNLFLHPPLAHPKRHVFEEFARNEAHYALQSPQIVYSASPPTFNTTDLVAALTPIKTGTLLLITGKAITANAHTPTRVTIGACMPTPWDIERQRSFRASPPQKRHRYTPDHMLFQLEPRHEILRPEANSWIMDLIHITISDPESGTKGSLRFGPEGASGLNVDFDSGIATLRNITPSKDEDTTHQESNQKREKRPSTPTDSTYHTISSSTTPGDNPAKEDWATSLRIQKLTLYDLGGHATAPFEEQLAQKPQLRAPSPESYRKQVIKGGTAPVPKISEPHVGEEVLKRRIKGFGSSGR